MERSAEFPDPEIATQHDRTRFPHRWDDREAIIDRPGVGIAPIILEADLACEEVR